MLEILQIHFIVADNFIQLFPDPYFCDIDILERRHDLNHIITELEHLIKESGMKIKNMYGDYNYSPLTNKSNDFVTECTK